MYGIKGNSYIAMGDPIGREDLFEKAIEEFIKFCKKDRKKCIFYEVDHENIGAYIKNNMIISKIGERGKVVLKNFTLDGSDMRKLRHLYSHLKKDNYNFKIIPKEKLDTVLVELESISQEWLDSKNTSEKRFSIGHFSKEYIKNFDLAILEKDGKIISFANIYGTSEKECLTLDLMRHKKGLKNSVMEYFFICLIQYAKEANFTFFSLGIVPLSGIEKEWLSPYKSIENFLFHYEKHFYNFRGLKLFKDKFNPLWNPVYITYYGRSIFPLIIKDIISLSSNGLINALRKKEQLKNQKNELKG